MKITTINPSTEEEIATYSFIAHDLIDEHIERTHQAYLQWRNTSFEQRKELMLSLSTIIAQQQQDLALLMTSEMGKPITAGMAELDKCRLLCNHYAEQAEHYLKPRIIHLDTKRAKVCYQPLGIVFGIMPWNFPFWQVLRFVVPALMAGNAAVLKHAPISTGTGNRIEQLFKEAGFPDYLFQHLIVDNEGAALVIQHPRIIAVTLTGSERAGRVVAAEAGKCLKKSVLELGGSDPYVVLADADLDLAAHTIVTSRLSNSGQVCIAAKRVIVLAEVAEELIKKIRSEMNAFIPADPRNSATTMGL